LIHSFNGDQEKKEIKETRKKEVRKTGFFVELQHFFSTTIRKFLFGEHDERYLRIRYVLLTFKTIPVQWVAQ
jgi:hypothetical protein